MCSDRVYRKFPAYIFDDRLRLVPGPLAPVVNFNKLKELLLSKDLSRVSELAHADQGEFRFLDRKVNLTGNMIAFQSFARCGNTFLRRFLEQITGIFTGSDMNITQTFNEAMMGLMG